MRDTVIIVGGGRLQIPPIQEARARGLKVVVVDGSATAPGLELADVPIIVSYSDVAGVLAALKKLSERHYFKAVMTAGTDATLTVAAIAREFGLPGMPVASARILTNKRLMREFLVSCGLPCPGFRAIRCLEDADRAAAEIGFPLVVKPVDNMGARGVLLVKRKNELEAAVQESFSQSHQGEALLEEHLTGPELSADVLISDATVYVLPPADRIIVSGPRFIELGHSLPSCLSPKILGAIKPLATQLVSGLDLTWGVIKLDLLVEGTQPVVIEMAGRLSGGRNSAVTIPLHSGINATALALKLALGERLDKDDITPSRSDGVVKRILLPEPGRVEAVEGIPDVLSWPGVYDVFAGVKPGELIPVIKSNVDRMFHIITVAKTRCKAERIAERALAKIKVTTSSL